MSRNGSIPDSTNLAISDRELLHVVHDHRSGEPDRRTQIAEIIDTLNLRHPNASRSLSVRLGYMARIGLVHKKDTDRWRLTNIGAEFIIGALTPTERGTIRALLNSPGRALEALHRIGQHERENDDEAVGYGLRRQWRHSTGRN